MKQKNNGLQICNDKCSAVLTRFGDKTQMIQHHTQGIAEVLSDPTRREKMILHPSPSVALMVQAYGREPVQLVVEAYVMQLADSVGVQYSRDSIKVCAQDIVTGWYYLTLYEVAAALRMAREGQFRDTNGRNIATMYGCFSSAAVIDCIAAFVRQVRNPLLEKEQSRKALENSKLRNSGYIPYKEWCKKKC